MFKNFIKSQNEIFFFPNLCRYFKALPRLPSFLPAVKELFKGNEDMEEDTAAGEPGTYLGGPPGMGGLSAGAMSPIQRSIFRGGHDPTGAGGRLSPGAQSPISSPQIRGHTAAGGAQSASPPWRLPPARPLFLLASRLVPPCSPLTLLRCTHCCVALTAPLVFARRPHHHRRRLTVRRRLARLWLAPLRRRGLPGSRLRKLAAAPGQNRRGLHQPNAAAQPDGLRRLR